RTHEPRVATARSRGSEGGERSAAAFGSTKPRRNVAAVLFAEPCSPVSDSNGYGPRGSIAPSRKPTTSRNESSSRRLRNNQSSSSEPSRTGSGRGSILAGRRNRTGGSATTLQA